MIMANFKLSKIPNFLMVLLFAVLLSACGNDKGTAENATVSYSQQIIPILQQHCFECHVAGQQGTQASGLDMSTYENLMKGTRFGPIIQAGNSLSSTLVILVEGRADPSIKMPHGDRPSLSEAEIKLLRQWIDQGAKNN